MTMKWYDYDNQPNPADLVDQSGPWTDRDDYESSRADHEVLFEDMQKRWTWPQRDRDGLTALERAEMERDLAAEALDRAEHDLERVREYLRSVER